MDWTVVDSENVEGNPVVTLELKDAPYSRAMWDFSFHALFKVKGFFLQVQFPFATLPRLRVLTPLLLNE